MIIIMIYMIERVIVMSIYQREDLYIKLLSERDRTVNELSKLLYVSEPTVRRDICEMKRKEIVISSRGCVSLKTGSADRRVPLFMRDPVNSDAKNIIASKAVKYIKDGDVVMLDASTTAYCLISHLVDFKNILCITNGAKTAVALASMGIKTLCCGGELAGDSFCFIGSEAESMISRYNADIAFFSCRGITQDGVATDSSLGENSIRRVMMKNSRKKFLLCDSTKIGQTYLNTLCNRNEIDGVIMD